ncbi:helix-turn-helix domain-containing protein [Streptomyces vinaceus]|uniref:helix-turn-helix domain-containing protein n=1 Tax=Streptomyces vinaceus TaxID=1960 RepID=UPI0036AF1D39
MSNLLAQHGQLSLLAMGVGLHIQSLPEGAKVSIRALSERFPESEHRIGQALRELEAAGFLRRTRLRTVDGKVVTRTVSYNLPLSETPPDRAPAPDPPQRPDPEPEQGPAAAARGLLPAPPLPGTGAAPRTRTPDVRSAPVRSNAARAGGAEPASAPPAGPGSEPDPAPEPGPVREPVREPSAAAPALRQEAARLLAGLRIREPRLLLSERDVEHLVPGVVEWLERGAAPEAVRRALTADVPSDLRNPAGLVAYRLRASVPAPLPPIDRAPAGPPPPDRPRYPLQTCDGCERAFRAPAPGGRCNDCTAHGRKAA